jgi:hypothetical protein
MAGSAFNPVVAVTVLDIYSNTVTSAVNIITISVSSGGAALGGNTTVAANGGIATFTGVTVGGIAGSYTLSATSAGLTGATSIIFNILPGVPYQLAFIVQPASNVPMGLPFNPAVVVAVEDAYGNIVSNATDSISISVSGGATISGTTTVATWMGMAGFTGVKVFGTPGNSYTLNATDSAGLKGAISNSFILVLPPPGMPYQLVFIVQPQPTNLAIGGAFSPAVAVAVQDYYGTTVITATDSITINVSGGALLGGTTTVAAIAGVATFNGVTVVGAPGSYTLNATDNTNPVINSGTSNSFNLVGSGTAGLPAQLVFIISPTDTATGNAFNPDVMVAIETITGTIISFDNTDIISITVSAGASLSGNTNVTVNSGIAKFTGITVTGTAAIYTLTAGISTTAGITPVTCSFRLCELNNWLQNTFPAGNGLDVFNTTITADAGGSVILTPTGTTPFWTRCITGTIVPGRYDYAMAYDSGRGKTVLYGGGNTMHVYGDTWEWDGTTWTQITTASSPGTRAGHAMAYDSGRGKIVLFGGCSDFCPGIVFSDIWEWDGINWNGPIAPADPNAPVPTPRMDPAMAYDPVNQVMVIFGGDDGWSMIGSGTYYGDTWTWDGKNRKWTPCSTPSGLTARSCHAMAYDSGRQRTVLFGGMVATTTPNTVFNDTWEWNGTLHTWTQNTTANPGNLLSGRYRHTMVYDGNQTVLYGGMDVTGTVYSDTWAYNGTTWSKKTISPHPSPRYSQAMAYDSGRQRTVLFGGMVVNVNTMNDTWELDSTNINAPIWTQVNLHGSPPARYGHAMAYDSLRQRTVLFGGETGSMMQDTWEWDGITWTKIAPACYVPNKRWYHAMAYDSLRHRTVLFGGLGASTLLQDIWDWDGKAWIPFFPVSTVISPSARCLFGMAYDSVRGKTVLYGGLDATGNSINDTWEWDGIYSNWTQEAGIPTGGRNSFAMAYDSGRQRTVLFGGWDIRLGIVFAVYNDTWKRVDRNWTKITTNSTVPAARYLHSMVYDSSRGVTVIFGGWDFNTPSIFNDTWELSGTTWTQITTNSTVPAARMNHAMAYDSVRRKTVLFGGIPFWGSFSCSGFYNDTWELGQTYNSSGTYLSAPITPTSVTSWGVLTYNATLPAKTSIAVDVLDSTTGNVIPQCANLPSGTDLSGLINATTYSVIKLRANLSTTDPNVTPALTSWRVEYK